MADSFIRTPDDSTLTGKKVRTQEVTVGANSVHIHYFILTGDDGTVLPWGGSSPNNAIGVNIAGEKSGGGFQYLRAESNPVSGEIGLNVNLMQYGETNGDLDTGAGTDNRLVTGIIGAASGGGQFIPGTSTDGLLVNLGTNNDVTVTSIVPGFGSTNLGKREDDGHTTLDVGVMALGVRADTLAAKAGTDADYEPIPVASIGGLVGVPIHVVSDDYKYVRGAQATNAAQVGGPVVSGAIGASSAPSAVTTGNVTNLWADLNGRLRITGDSSMSPVMVGVSAATSIATVEDQASANGDTLTKVAAIRRDTPAANANVSADGDYTQFLLDNTGKLWIAGSHKEDDAHASGDRGVFVMAVANSDTTPTTYAAAQDYLPFAANTDGSVWVVGNRAHDTADAGGPVKVGGKAVSIGTVPTAVANNDRVDSWMDTSGRQYVAQAHSFARISTAATTTVKSGAGVLHTLTINTTAAGTITIYDNTAASGTVIAIIAASTAEKTLTYDIRFGTGLTIVTAAASDLTVSYL